MYKYKERQLMNKHILRFHIMIKKGNIQFHLMPKKHGVEIKELNE